MRIRYETYRFRKEARELIAVANTIIEEYMDQGFVLTLRQLYYQFVARNFLPNDVHSYGRLGGLISKGRRAGLIDWNAIEDRTRFLRKNAHWSSPHEILQACAHQYQEDKWSRQPTRVEVWIEKDALLGTIERACQDNDVPFSSCRGYTSDSEIWRAAQRIDTHPNQPTLILHLSDHDPSGIDMTRDLEARLNLFVQRATWRVERIALTTEEVQKFHLPANPAKVTDSRYSKYQQKYGQNSWELDALDPSILDQLVRGAIGIVLDSKAWKSACRREQKGRRVLLRLADSLPQTKKR